MIGRVRCTTNAVEDTVTAPRSISNDNYLFHVRTQSPFPSFPTPLSTRSNNGIAAELCMRGPVPVAVNIDPEGITLILCLSDPRFTDITHNIQ